MKREGLKPSQLAEMLGINPAGISHILKDRNKPSFDLLQKILRRFPQINPDWLLLDSTQMYRDEHTGIPQASALTSAMQLPINSDLFGSAGTDDTEVPAVKTNRREPEAFAAADQSVTDQFPVSRTEPTFSVSYCFTTTDLRKFHVDKALKIFRRKNSPEYPTYEEPKSGHQNSDTIIKSTPFFRCAFFMSRNWHATCCPPPHKNELILPLC